MIITDAPVSLSNRSITLTGLLRNFLFLTKKEKPEGKPATGCTLQVHKYFPKLVNAANSAPDKTR